MSELETFSCNYCGVTHQSEPSVNLRNGFAYPLCNDCFSRRVKPAPEHVLPIFPPKQADGTVNPKDAAALTRVPMHLLPAVGTIYGAMACKDGADKYGPYNWRERAISLTQYIGAMDRHLKALLDGEDCASDSKLPHLAHVIATAAILLDAKEAGALLDDRPKRSGNAAGLIERLNADLKAKAAAK
jgi:hypothetical protein